jgi:hypothetical protein
MRVIAGSCPNANCPKVLDLDDGDVLVQGYETDLVETPSGEQVVRLSRELILEAADNLRSGPGQ